MHKAGKSMNDNLVVPLSLLTHSFKLLINVDLLLFFVCYSKINILGVRTVKQNKEFDGVTH